MDRKMKPEWIPFGAGLRRLRKERGLTGTATALGIGLSPTMYSSIERGRRFCLREHAVRLDEVLESGDEVIRLWTKMVSPERLPEWFYRVPELERAASEIREYQPLLIPGLLQTERYARALFRAVKPWAKRDEIERMMDARLERWELLDDERRPLLWFVISGTVLRSPVGTDASMQEQLDHLTTLVEDEKIHLQVLPMDARVNPGKSGPFRIYSFPDKPTLASAEYMTGEIVLDEMAKLRQCEVVFGALQAAALPVTETLEQISKAREVFK
ncbi:helix-turn-helix transcriptional regulator [Nocardiopsis sp. NPDC006198]|uniref:helix-turn-helix domain-containing protein n=1 Tax=Nocardiopsis sp. NPDC006198 TaxID=3154472 RepID=UPI0033A94A01